MVTLERLLLPFGLHHMLTIPMNYTALGGTYDVLTGAAKELKYLVKIHFGLHG